MVKLNVRKKMGSVLVKWVMLVTQPSSRTSVNNLEYPLGARHYPRKWDGFMMTQIWLSLRSQWNKFFFYITRNQVPWGSFWSYLQRKDQKCIDLEFIDPQERLAWPYIAQLLFSCSVASMDARHARPPCPSPSPRACSILCPLNWWCHPTTSSSATLFSSCLQSCPASESFLISQFFASGGQSIGASTSASILPMNIQDWFPLGLTSWISLPFKGLSRVHIGYPIVKSSTLQKWYNHYTPVSHLIVSTVELSAWCSETPRKGMLLGTA